MIGFIQPGNYILREHFVLCGARRVNARQTHRNGTNYFARLRETLSHAYRQFYPLFSFFFFFPPLPPVFDFHSVKYPAYMIKRIRIFQKARFFVVSFLRDSIEFVREQLCLRSLRFIIARLDPFSSTF